MERGTAFYQGYLLARIHACSTGQVTLRDLISDLETCGEYLPLSDQQLMLYERLMVDLETLYACSLDTIPADAELDDVSNVLGDISILLQGL